MFPYFIPAQRRAAWSPARAQEGQAIILVALAIIGLVAVTGLAVDGGQVYLTQQQAENAADAALIAATRALCEGKNSATVSSVALAAAVATGYDNNGTTNTVTVNNPPSDGPFAGNSEFVEVIIWADSPTYFVQIVYQGPTEITSTTYARCRPPIVAFSGYSFAALSEVGNKAFDFSGNASVEFCGGGVWSNAGAESSNNSVPTADGSCTAPTFTSVGDWLKDTNMTGAGFTVDEQTQSPVPDPFAGLSPPANPGNCATNGDLDDSGSPYTISGPTCYESIDCKNNETVVIQGDTTRNDNILYIDGGASIKCEFTANDVFIYMTGAMSMNSQAASVMTPMLNGGDWQGMMMWVDGNDFRINGGSGSAWTGTIYIPNAGATVNGGSNSIYRSQLIAQTIDFAGGNNSKIIYDESKLFTFPPAIEINQ